MASAILHCSTLFLFLLVAGSCDATDEYYNILDFAMERRHEKWMAEYGREYKDEGEKARRLEIFKKNVEYIEDFNNGGEYNYTLGVNQFADLTPEEFMAFYAGGVYNPQERIEELAWSTFENKTIVDPISLPSSVDWRDQDALNPVRNQERCASCWAFAAVATIESLHKIKNDVLPSLSEQQLVDCDRSSQRGCMGGSCYDAYLYTSNNGGLTTEANYPYRAAQDRCDRQKENETVATVSDNVGRVPRYSEDELMAAVARQPVAALVRVTSLWQFFNGGIFSGPCGKGPAIFNHFVAVVGYNETDSSPYWILRNSWGSNWAEGGYIKLAMGGDERAGLCDILTDPIYPTL